MATREFAVRSAARRWVEKLEFRTLFSSISGMVFNDPGGSGSYSAGDVGLGGVSVFDDINNNGQLDSGEPSASTAGGGTFTLDGVPLDSTQTVRAIPPVGFAPSSPSGGAASALVTDDAPDATGINLGMWLPPVALSSSTIEFEEGQTFTGTVATLVDAAGANSDAGTLAGTILWNSSSYPVSFTSSGTGSGSYVVQASGLSTLSAGTYSVAVNVAKSGDGQSASDQTYFTVIVDDAPLSASGESISAVAHVAWAGTVATFTDPDPNATASTYSCSVAYGDGSGTSSGTISSNGSGGWIVSDTHTFSSAGIYSLSITINDNAGASVTTTASASVSLAPISLSPCNIELQEGQSFCGTVATLNDQAGAASDSSLYAGTIIWNGVSYAVTFSQSGVGTYDVQAANLPRLSAGNCSATITVTESSSGQSTGDETDSSISVSDAPLSVSGANVSANVEVPWSGPMAAFTDPDPNATASNYTASVLWEDGSTGACAVTSDGVGGWVVSNSDPHTFADAGNFSPAVTITDIGGGSSTTVSASAAVSLASISVVANDVSLNEGDAFTGSLGTLTDGAREYSNGDCFCGTVLWNGTSYPVGFTSNGAGSYFIQASASLPAFSAGTYNGLLSVVESAGGQSLSTSAEFSIYVAVVPISAQAVPITATVGVPWSGPVATFTDADPNAALSNYTATTDYEDGQGASSDTISAGTGNWGVSGSHTFVLAGYFSPSTTVSASNGAQGIAQTYDSALANLAGISLSPTNAWLAEGQYLSGNIGTLTDDAGQYASGNYSGLLALGGTNYEVTFVSQLDGDYAVKLTDGPTLPAGSYWGTLTATESNNGQIVSASTPLAVNIADALLSANGATITATNGVAWTGPVATFTDPDPTATVSNYSATIAFGDGNTSAGTITSDGSGGWVVTGSNTFPSPGSYSTTVTIIDNGGASAVANGSASVALAGISLGACDIVAQELTPYSGVVATLTDQAGAYANSVNYSGTILWNGVSYSVGFTANGTGSFLVVASDLPPRLAGSHSAIVSVNESCAGQSVGDETDSSVTVADAPITATGATFSATAGVAWTGAVATFTDPDLTATGGTYVIAINYGDGTPVSSTDPAVIPSPTITLTSDGVGNWTINDTHTFPNAANLTPSITISDVDGAAASCAAACTVHGVTASMSGVSSSLMTPSGYALFADAQYGTNGTAYGGPEQGLGAGSDDMSSGRQDWDSTNSPQGFNSGVVPVDLNANVGDGASSWAVNNQGISYDGACGQTIGSIQLIAAVQIPATMKWSDIYIQFFKNGVADGSISIGTGPQVDTTNSVNASAEQILTITPANSDDDSVLVSANIQMSTLPGNVPGATDMFSQVLVFAH